MNAYLNQIIQTFQYGVNRALMDAYAPVAAATDKLIAENFRSDYLGEFKTGFPIQPIEFPTQEDEEIRFLHETYDTELHECDYCCRLYEAERDMDGWFDSQYCEDCYWDLNGEGRD